MAVKTARDIEHEAGQTRDVARRGTVAKPSGPAPIHPGMASRSRGASLGAAPTGNPADAVDPRMYSSGEAGKKFPLPKAAHAQATGDGAAYDPALAFAIMNEARRDPADFAGHGLSHELPDEISTSNAKPVREPDCNK